MLKGRGRKDHNYEPDHDVYTVPTKVAREFLAPPPRKQLNSHFGSDFRGAFPPETDPQSVTVLWTIDDRVRVLTEEMSQRAIAALIGDEIYQADRDFGTRLFPSSAWKRP